MTTYSVELAVGLSNNTWFSTWWHEKHDVTHNYMSSHELEMYLKSRAEREIIQDLQQPVVFVHAMCVA